MNVTKLLLLLSVFVTATSWLSAAEPSDTTKVTVATQLPATKTVAIAKASGKADVPAIADSKAKSNESPNKPVDPKSLTLRTSDGVGLHCIYYQVPPNKEVVPVILLHGWTGPRGAGSARDFDDLAFELQSAGYAVIVPDLRGHGRSTVRKTRVGKQRVTRRQLNSSGIAAMVSQDVEAVKRFLIDEHNEGRLNVELLTVVGSEMGAVVAANWAAQDWSWPTIRHIKQGQDARALVLISPPPAFRSLSLTKAMSFAPLTRLPTMIAYGSKDAQAVRDIKRIQKQLAPHYRNVNAIQLSEVATSLRGTELLKPRLETIKSIRTFIDQNVTANRDRRPWRSRSTVGDS